MKVRASAAGVPLRVAGSYVQWTAVTLPSASFVAPVHLTM